jgi:predicted transcriptional regulator YdeE
MRFATRKLAVLPALFVAPALLAQTAPAPTQTAPATSAAPAPATPAAAAAPTPAPAPAPPKIEDQESFVVVGATVRTDAATEAGGDGKIPGLWQDVFTNGTLDQIPNRIGDGLVVVYSDYAPDGKGAFDYNYTLGVRVSAADKVPDGMVKRVIPAGKYAVLQSEQGAPQEVIPALWQRIAQLTPQELGGARAYQIDFETFPAITDFSSMQSTAHLGLK